jgi:hypothetical protein
LLAGIDKEIFIKLVVMKPKGKISVRKAVEELFPIMPEHFMGLHLHKLVMRRIGRPELYSETTFRKLRELKEDKVINFRNIDRAKSQYEKLPVNQIV